MSVYDLYQSYLNAQKQVAPQPSLGILDPRLLYPQNYQGGDGLRGAGLFGNLDPSTKQTLTVDVYDEEEGDFVPTEIEAYRNLSSGLLQDYSGRNVQPAFSNTGITPGLIGLATQALGFAPKTVGGYVPGSYRGVGIFGQDAGYSRTPQQISASKKADEVRMQNLRTAQITGGGGGGGRDTGPSQSQRDAGPGFSGSGSAEEMGSF